MLVKSRQLLPEIAALCVACINWQPASAGWNPKKANTAIPRPIVDKQLFIITRLLADRTCQTPNTKATMVASAVIHPDISPRTFCFSQLIIFPSAVF